MSSHPDLLQPVILCGGVGKRLWPVSRSSRPKQLHAMIGDRTMLQTTIEILDGFATEGPMIVCGSDYVAEIERQASTSTAGRRSILVEPEGRNTAAAVAAAALSAPEGSVVIVLPSDHHLGDRNSFLTAMERAVRTADAGHIVTFGIVPDRPATGYGYIEAGAVIEGDVRKITRFVEKPDHDTAVGFLESGDFLWNSGMFVFRREACLSEFERHAPEILHDVAKAIENRRASPSWTVLGDEFRRAPSVPFDRAIMERTDRGAVVPLDAAWSDIGSWHSMWELLPGDGDGNVVLGDARMIDVRDSFVRTNGKVVALLGLRDVVVVDTGDAILVADRNRSQDVGELVSLLREKNSELT